MALDHHGYRQRNIAVQTQYDALGRAFKVSNPFRPWQSESAIWTTTAFDALGRVLTVTTPDSAVVASSYSGNTVTVTDQTGKARKSLTDGVGRLAQVYEDPSGLNYLTSYSYDPLDNLTGVSQGSQTRTFVYDSLKRLSSATNPESGTVSYSYDNNGNLTSKLDARNITTTFAYDALNRVTSKSYNDSPQTPTVSYFYDSQSLPGGAPSFSRGYATGRLVALTYGSGSSAGDYYGYDAAGHTLLKIQQTGGINYQTSASYNLAGAPRDETYPSVRTVSYTYDTAGRTNAFSGNLGDGVNRTYATAILYSPLGGMTKEQFGTDTAIYNKLFYNSRGQLAEIRESTSYTGATDTTWNRGAIINHYSNGCWGMCGGSNSTTPMTEDNCNLKKQEVYIPSDDQVSSYTTWWQGYDYDSLNRLQRVHELTGNPATEWQQEYVYDAQGNRTIHQTNSWGAGAPKPNFGVATATNRLTPPAGYTMSYDAAGNLSNDTYTGAGSRSYDAENRMTQAWANGQWQYYTYDGDGQRVRRNVNGVESWQVYGMGGELLAEYAANAAAASAQKEYGYRNGQLLVSATVPLTVGSGLQGQYFDNLNFTDLKVTRSDATVDFDWGGGTPDAAIGVDTFSVRWQGKVEPQYSQSYTFYTQTDDGVRLWVNGQLVIDKWIDQGPTEWSGQLTLTAGQRYDIVMEFYENGGGAMARLSWSSASQAKQIIPQSRLYPPGSSSQVAIEWLVTDQLGTPRMVFDKSGSLANTKRHDYLPFGEELFAGTGGRTPQQGYGAGDGVRQHFTRKERDNETGLDYFGARYYASTQGRFTSVDPITVTPARVVDPQQLNLYAYVRNNPLAFVDPTGMIIDTGRLDDKQLERWQKIADLANQQDKKGNYVNAKLHEEYEKLNNDSRTFFIENKDFGSKSGTIGEFRITKFNGDKDFSEAVIQLDFKKLKNLESPTAANLVPGFNKFEGLFGKNGQALRGAELFGHEGAHGIFALDNVAEAVKLQMQLNDRDAALGNMPKGTKFPYPPDVMQKLEAAEKGLIPTERYAQQTEKIINGELRASSKKKN